MKLKEILAKHSVDSAELLSDLEAFVDGMDTIPKSRFNEVIKQRNEAKADLAEKESQVTDLSAKVNTLTEKEKELAAYKTKWEKTETERFENIKTKWENESKIFDIDETDKRFEKVNGVKDSFIFGTEEKPLTQPDIEKNLEKLNLLKKTGVFEVPSSGADFDKGKPKDKPKPTVRDEKNAYLSMFKKK